jgi:hypothetical protein
MDILLSKDGDLYLNENGDIVLCDSVAQKIKIRLKWFEGEWRWDIDEGIPYFSSFFVKNPNINFCESFIRRKIFEVDEVTDVKDVKLTFDKKTRTAVIRYTALTDIETIREEVELQCQIME